MRCFRLLPYALFALTASSVAQLNPALFAPTVAYSSSGYAAFSVAVADLNGDGKQDLVIGNLYASEIDKSVGAVAVLLGNGDGTFQPAVSFRNAGGNVLCQSICGQRQCQNQNECSGLHTFTSPCRSQLQSMYHNPLAEHMDRTSAWDCTSLLASLERPAAPRLMQT